VQKRRLLAISSIPSRTSLLEDTASLGATGFNGWLSQHWREGMFDRPSVQSGGNYPAISAAYSKTVHAILSGKDDPHEALTRLQAQLITLTGTAKTP
jgi:ABC-type glycerol-3-phosphate transport system substrate-binding protein